ncbi:MAG: DUF4012 domain-containing protein [Actinomycetota bacterium]|nr:DUF4012 domain-containing protein [Actinomycetota bacterium]
MDPPWVYAFLAALAVTIGGTPLLRRLALSANIVDHPDHRKSHVTPVPYLGGVGIMAGVLVALLFLPGLGGRAAALGLVAVTLGAVGLLDDDRNVPPGVRFLAEAGAAGLAVAVGLRIHATGITVIDMILTMVWILGITNALNLLDNMDGLTTGVAGTVATGVFFLAIFDGQVVVATVSAGLAGACCGFLVYNRRPASIFMGDAGSLFLGFSLAVLAIDVSPGLAPPVSFVVPIILLGLAVLDTTTVTLSRLRRGRSVSTGGKDHLSHRLVALGVGPGRAVGILIGVQVVLSVLAVLAGRQVLGPWAACGAAILTLGTLAVVTSRATVYPEPAGRFPGWLRFGLAGGMGLVVLLSAPAIVAMVTAAGPAQEGADAATSALHAAGAADPGSTRADLERAEVLFRRAQGRLDGGLASLGLLVPGVSSNLRAARTLAATGSDLAAKGARVIALADAGGEPVSAGSVDTDQLARLSPVLDDAARALTQARTRLGAADRPYLIYRFREPIRDLVALTGTEARTATLMAETARTLPGLLGTDGPRRYLLMVRGGDPSGSATAGPVVQGDELVAESGHLRLEPIGSAGPPMPASAAAISSPDFPTVARALSGTPSPGDRVDGVICVDETGLSALTGLSGPVSVVGEPDPVPAANVADVVTRTSISRVSTAVWGKAVTADLGTGRHVVAGLADAVRGGHLMAYLARPGEEALLSRLGATGEVPAIRGDSVIVVGENIPSGGADRYLHGQVNYDVRLDPGPQQTHVSEQVAVTLRNDAPVSASGGEGPNPAAGSQTSVSVYSPFPTTSAAVDGKSQPLRTGDDLGRRTGSAVLGVPPSEAHTLRFDMAGEITLGHGGWYRLDVLPELGSLSEAGRVTVSVSSGWRISDTRGLSLPDANHATGPVPSDRAQSLWVRVTRTPTGRLWDSLLGRG